MRCSTSARRTAMLDLFFKKYVWIANAVLVFAAAWLAAKTVNTVAGALIRPRPRVDLAAAPPAAPPAPPRAMPSNERLYALLGQKPPAPPPTAAAGAAPAAPRNCDDARANPVRSTLRAQLVGVALSDRPQWSLASITDLTTRETRLYGIGDAVLGARLLGIERMAEPRDATGAGFRVAAVFCHSGQKEYLDFDSGDGAAAPSVPPIGSAPVPPPTGPAGAPMEGIRKVSDTQYEIQRSVIDSTLNNMSQIATQARIVPSFKNGVANGFKLFSIQPGSLYASIGMENGDVIQRINGFEINSPDKALEVYQKLRNSSHITIELERNGRPVRKEYNVAGP
jgi:general secretion pathway protein C